MNLEKKILYFINKKNYIPLTKEELVIALDISFNEIETFFNLLNNLVDKKKLQINNYKYSIYEKNKLLKGKITFTPKGYAFFIADDEDIDDIFISKNDLNKANHNDYVEIELIKNKTNKLKAEGKVVKVLNRNSNLIVGTFVENKNFGFVISDDKKFNYDVFIKKKDKNGAKNDDKVVCKILEFPDKRKNPEGVIIEVIGNKDDKDAQIISLLKEFNIPYKFSTKLNKELEEIKALDIKKEIKSRTDFRKLFTVTIDGADSKDFDDAISIEKNKNDYILYTHIADVSHYVKKNSKLDNEAYKRGNSVYLFDYVVPMLPKELSNDLCSLNPNKDRLAITVKMVIDFNGNIKEYKFYESVINSNFRLVYDDVSNFIENKKDVFKNEILKEKLILMEELNDILYKKRKLRGNIDFDFPEVNIEFNKDGSVKNISKKEIRIANKIIESFMICTNEVVGKHFSEIDIPIIYRIHKKPLDEKIENLKTYFSHISISSTNDELLSSKYLNKLIEKYKDTPKSSFINYAILRAMNKAVYSSKIDIHFGLSSFFYCHFTSPIRRYADLVVHRTLKNFLHSRNFISKNYIDYLSITSNHINETEIKAMDIERKLEDIKKIEFMKNKIGFVFNANVVSVTSFGIFVKLENTVEGLIRYEDITDDYYIFDENSLTAIGKRTKNVFDIGMSLEVILAKVNDVTNEIEFLLNR